MKTLLLISYHWPPAGGAGVYRWLKMARYLHEFGWQLVVYTPEEPEVPVLDTSLLAEVPPQTKVLRQPVREPYYRWYRLLTGRRSGDAVYSGLISESRQRSPMERLAIWIRGNCFIPDPRRSWVRPSVRYLARVLRDIPVDVMVSTGPPHSMHLIAMSLATGTGIPWVADFRDPWTGIDYYEELGLTRWAARRHAQMERAVLAAATRVVTVSPSWAAMLETLGGRPVEVIANGYDPADFTAPAPAADRDFSICHFGSMHRSRDPVTLWKALQQLMAAGHPLLDSLRVELVGPVDYQVMRSADQHGLADKVVNTPYIPHSAAIARMRSAQVLMLPINRSANARGVIPGKLFEYLGAGRPILLLGPREGDAARIVSTAAAGCVAQHDEAPLVADQLRAWFQAWREGGLETVAGRGVAYSRRELAGEYAALLDGLG